MKNTTKLNQQGFSLVELMIVVAIIGLLAAVGVPQYQKFQARARQGEAKSALAALYASEQSFYGEWNLYTVDLKNIGFGVTGTGLRYVTGFAATACTGYLSAAAANGAPAETAAVTNTRSDGTAVRNSTTWGTSAAGAANQFFQSVAFPAGSSCISTASAAGATFISMAVGNPNNALSAAFPDRWTINQVKKISNSMAGIQ